jgi:hypothetical protein
MFKLTADEKAEVVANCDHLAKLKFSKVLPFTFTEHGAIQAANVLASPQAVEMGIFVVRVFVRMRELASVHADLAKRLSELEQKTEGLALTHDTFSRNTRNQLKQLIEAVNQLMAPPDPPKRPIGFVTPKDKSQMVALYSPAVPRTVILSVAFACSPLNRYEGEGADGDLLYLTNLRSNFRTFQDECLNVLPVARSLEVEIPAPPKRKNGAQRNKHISD